MGRRILQISSDLLVQLFGEGRRPAYESVSDALPDDACLVNAKIAFPERQHGGDLVLLLESASWPEVGEGEPIPNITPTFKRITPTD